MCGAGRGLEGLTGASSLEAESSPRIGGLSDGLWPLHIGRDRLCCPPRLDNFRGLDACSYPHIAAMTQRILKSLLIAAALTASTGIAASPAVADVVVKKPHITIGPGGFGVERPGVGAQTHGFGARHRNSGLKKQRIVSRSLKIDAARTCSYKLRADAAAYGYKGVELIDTDIEQLGRAKFAIHAKAKLFDGYSYQIDGYECLVDHGEVITTSDLAPAKVHDTVIGGGFFNFN